MIIRKAIPADAEDLKILYFEYLTNYPPQQEQNMDNWRDIIQRLYENKNSHLLVAEVDGKVVSTVYLTVIENLTHNNRPFGIIENVVTHINYRNKGIASALLEKATILKLNVGELKIHIADDGGVFHFQGIIVARHLGMIPQGEIHLPQGVVIVIGRLKDGRVVLRLQVLQHRFVVDDDTGSRYHCR